MWKPQIAVLLFAAIANAAVAQASIAAPDETTTSARNQVRINPGEEFTHQTPDGHRTVFSSGNNPTTVRVKPGQLKRTPEGLLYTADDGTTMLLNGSSQQPRHPKAPEIMTANEAQRERIKKHVAERQAWLDEMNARRARGETTSEPVQYMTIINAETMGLKSRNTSPTAHHEAPSR